ncbi:MAG: DNA gyrase subunit B, partial [Eubacteriales bacterium]|nr:DNA gyrase subunit B [Eubacteriales bacterium]
KAQNSKAQSSGYDASSITVLEGLEPVRTRPGMYIGGVGAKGLNHLVYEILDNSVDEHLAGYCTEIWVTLEKDGSCTIRDNGRGLPVDLHQKGVSAERVILTTLHAGGKFDNQAYKTSGGLHGVGSSVVNALSKQMTVEVSRNGRIYRDTYSRGIPTTELIDGLLPVVGKSKTTGTTINFTPDDEIFEKTVFKSEWIKSRLHETAYLNPELTIHYSDLRDITVNAVRSESFALSEDGQFSFGLDEASKAAAEEDIGKKPADRADGEHIDFHEPEGLKAYVKELNKGDDAVTELIYFKDSYNDCEVECCFQYVDAFEENIHGFCNNIFTQEGGTHITGFKTKYTQLINTYAKQLGILKEKDANFTGADTRNGMTCVVAIKFHDPIFEGQTKTKLASAEAAADVAYVTGEKLEHYFDRNIETVKSIIACAEKSARIRKAEEKAKTNMLSKNKFSFDSNGKLKVCTSKDPSKCEIFIVEGDSAGGSAGTGRNREFQAILPIRGKILNVEKASMDKVLANAEIKTMINSFGCGFSEGYGNDFDITKLRYNKIILMTDADVDGSHIDTLLLTFFYRFMPELIYNGHVYVSMPPLYLVTPKSRNGKPQYMYNDRELAKYQKDHEPSTYELKRFKGLGEMDPPDLWATTLDPERRVLKRVEIEDARLASEVTEMLMGTDVGPRRDFIYEHANEAEIDT